MNDYKFGNFVCSLREEKGLTQADIASALGVTPAAVSKWEGGSSKPRVEVLFRLADILGVRAEELMAGERLPIEEVSEEKVREITEKYEYLKKTESYSETDVKLKRIIAFMIDWNACGVTAIVLIPLLSLFFMLPGKKIVNNALLAIFILTSVIIYISTVALRDVIFGGRSLGKRIMGLEVIDARTGDKARPFQRIVRTLFFSFMQIDGVLMLISGRSIGDRVAHTLVVSRKKHDSVSIPTSYSDAVSEINAYIPPKDSKKKVFITAGCIALAFILFVGVILAIVNGALAAETKTERYAIAYAYLTESETVKSLGIEEKEIKLTNLSTYSQARADGTSEGTAEYGFSIRGRGKLIVVCHERDGVWSVCKSCTEFD